jgi:antirestriction protein
MTTIHPQEGGFRAHQAQELSTDERAIQFGIEAARAEDREVDDGVARCIAAQLHGGQDTALYSFVSTGNLEDERLDNELLELYRSPDPRILEWASVLGTYALHREDRGPVNGWHELWPNRSGGHAPDEPTPEDGDAEARANLMQRLNAAAVTTLGQVATIVTAEGVYGREAEGQAEAEADIYPWSDAAHWQADGGPDELAGAEIAGMDSRAVAELFGRLPDAQFGSTEQMGWCGLVHHDGRPGGAILQRNQYGRRSAWTTDSDDELSRRWEELRQQHDAFQEATRAGRGEASSGTGPEIWVGSLADYNAGRLHGVWLDATLEPDELASAVQFLLKNSYEPDAEEYAVMDYDGFGDAAGLLGEYPNLETVSKVARGIEEHGLAFAAWVEYVGPEQVDQLERFQDHYLGEWESIEAYAEELLQESEAFRVIEEAPEWLGPYLKVDVEGYARDLEMELHVAETPDGGVWVFDTHS